MGRETFDRCDQVGFGLGVLLQRGPLHVKPLAEHLRFGRAFGRLNQAERVAWGDTQAFAAERKGAERSLLCGALCIP